MSAGICTEEQFLRDVAEHEMTVIRDDGVNRHIRFRRPDSSNMYFDLITWPGHLCYTGGMGTYVFQRLEDMFEFFRTDPEHTRRMEVKLYVNRSYWGEKLMALDRGAGYRAFCPDEFESRIMEWIRDAGLVGKLGHGSRDEIESEVLAYAEDGAEAAYQAAMKFKYKGKYIFENFYEVDCEQYAYRYTWCCYALAWGIAKYDDAKAAASVVEGGAP